LAALVIATIVSPLGGRNEITNFHESLSFRYDINIDFHVFGREYLDKSERMGKYVRSCPAGLSRIGGVDQMNITTVERDIRH
jgi:hypothetical protein